MRLNTLLTILIVSLLTSCAGNQSQLTASVCEEPGTIGSDRVLHPTQGFEISFQYYLPPCYEKQTNASFPVIYLITMPLELELSPDENTPMSLADRLIRAKKMPPAILIVPQDTAAHGYHEALATDLVSYVDQQFRTIRDRQYRGVGGISHGAAIAARMAFQFPQTFGSLGIFSGGIDKSEVSTFTNWITAAPPEVRPRLLIDIGDQDGIMALTRNLLNVLDAQNVPYEMKVGAGGHHWGFWSGHMESYLLWFARAWE